MYRCSSASSAASSVTGSVVPSPRLSFRRRSSTARSTGSPRPRRCGRRAAGEAGRPGSATSRSRPASRASTPAIRQHRALELLPFPGHVVGELHRQLGQASWLPGHLAAVQRGQVRQQHPHRPVIEHRLVGHEHQHVLVAGEPRQAGPQRVFVGEVERPQRLVVGELPHRRSAASAGRVA